MIKRFAEKISKIKHKELILIVIIILTIVIMLFVSGRQANTVSVNLSDLSDTERLEYDIRSAVKSISGDGDASVIVVWDKITEKNEGLGGSIFGGGSSSVEKKVKSVAVICDGGSKAEIKVKITLMLCSLLDLSSDNVYVNGKK